MELFKRALKLPPSGEEAARELGEALEGFSPGKLTRGELEGRGGQVRLILTMELL